MEEIKIEEKTDSSEARKNIHTIVEGLADLADKGCESAIVLLQDFWQFGEIVVASGGKITLDQIMVMATSCSDPNCTDHDAHKK